MTHIKPAVVDRAPIAVALDAPDLAVACAWAREVSPSVRYLKVGLETYLRDGARGVADILAAAGDGPGLFLDLKFHDIPNTVAGAARSVAGLHPALLTVHASGGPAMIAAAAEQLPDTLVTAVTVLTSMSESDLAAIGMAGPSQAAATRLAVMAVAAGARAIVCSPREVAAIRDAVGPDIVLVTPGVRPVGADIGDQNRVATPQEALAAGADVLVIGRPITGSDDPAVAAQHIAQTLLRI